jgi:hypothetical protein
MVSLVLDVVEPDLTPMEDLLAPPVLGVLAQAVTTADQPYAWATEHVVHAIDHLRVHEYIHAWPPLVTGVDGLYWAEAEQRGFIDASGRFTAVAPTGRTRPRSAIEVFAVLGMNERVRRSLSRAAFSAEADAFRHGRVDPIGPLYQCLVWLVALAAWIDGWGWPRPA